MPNNPSKGVSAITQTVSQNQATSANSEMPNAKLAGL